MLTRKQALGGLLLALVAAAGATAYLQRPQGPEPGPLTVSPDDRLFDEQRADGRIWRVYNDCPMARNTTWTSDDGGRRWLKHEGPGVINCTVASDIRLRLTSRSSATAEVDQGPEPIHNIYRTDDGAKTWILASTDLRG